MCILLPKITEITPAFSNNGIEQNTPIEITFNKSLDSATFTDFSSIILIENETRDLWEFFNTPYFSSSGTKLVIPPNPEKLILAPDGSQNLLELKVTYDFSKASDIDGLPLDLSGSHSYRINKT
ncbi:MAG: Ig-like domain-containing protein, partial [Treponema sp.]|nr:Ig-like domain-containing protein [Treponema sp.]